MTTTTILGPFVIGWVLAGGTSAKWPPDRAVEWVTLLSVVGLVLVLMLACLSLSLTTRRTIARATPPPAGPEPDEPAQVAAR